VSEENPSSTANDPLDAVSTAARIWRRAVAARAERRDLDRAIVRAFETGRTGSEIADAGGLDVADVYRVHKRIEQINADDDLDAKLAETSRRTAELSERLKADPVDLADESVRESPAIPRSSTPDPLRLPWRVGRNVGRAIYAIVGFEAGDEDVLIRMMDTEELAREACLAHNRP
jgi:hypothetical protein